MLNKEELSKDRLSRPAIKNEVHVMRRLRGHPNIIRLYETYESANSIYLVMELLRGGSLQARIQKHKRMAIDHSLAVVKQLAEALNFMHQRRVMHRDMKLANVLLVDEEDNVGVKIVDFGLATDADQVPYIYQRCGTPGYVAPEVFRSSDGEPYSPICDVFSLGVLLYIIVTGRMFFKGDSYKTVLSNNKRGEIDYQAIRLYVRNPAVFELVCGMVEPDPARRFTLKEVQENQYLKDLEVDIPLAEMAMDKSPATTPTHRFNKDLSGVRLGHKTADDTSFVCGKTPLLNGRISEVKEVVDPNVTPPLTPPLRSPRGIELEEEVKAPDVIRQAANILFSQQQQKEREARRNEASSEEGDVGCEVDEREAPISRISRAVSLIAEKPPSKSGRALCGYFTPGIYRGRIQRPPAEPRPNPDVRPSETLDTLNLAVPMTRPNQGGRIGPPSFTQSRPKPLFID
eukprot:TRINITY_DN6301_c0_g1_i1.p1 TRINITY_DN6301_c0_g1~~TRINITY_DN6301_c0_g1_i1.p1  ORF type:complete len:458 (-),score=67.68 TRINITY_DN6301_c0_g1_i1:45-1418(-)